MRTEGRRQTDRQTDRRADMMKLIVAFRIFVTATKNYAHQIVHTAKNRTNYLIY